MAHALRSAPPMLFVPTAKPDEARGFYQDVLGLEFVADDTFAQIFKIGDGLILRVQKAPAFKPHPFTQLGWQTNDIGAMVAELGERGVKFEKYGFPGQDDRGIMTFENGDQVAWFKDPDGNVLSVSQLANAG